MRHRTRSLLTALSFASALLGPPPGASEAQEDEPSLDTGGRDRHAVRDGETLSSIAEGQMGSADAWPKLWSYNPEITNPHYIYPGHVLRLREGVDLTQPESGGGATDASGRTGSLLGLRQRGARSAPGVVRLGDAVYLDGDALAQAARIDGSHEDHLMLSPSDLVYLKLGDGQAAPEKGRELTVFVRGDRRELNPRASRYHVFPAGHPGEVVRVVGAVRVLSYDGESRVARALVIEALEPIERGFEVADVPRRLAEVAPRKNAADVNAKIVAATRALGTLGDGQVVFLDAGSKQGVDVGNRFMVVRQGDTWRRGLSQREDMSGADRPDRHPPSDTEFPVEAVGELRVLYVRPDSSTALITRADSEVGPGDRVEMRAGY
ncbi:MAG: LysM peptidoglycan-binding domain-containing protein [Polyangiales bacterium]